MRCWRRPAHDTRQQCADADAAAQRLCACAARSNRRRMRAPRRRASSATAALPTGPMGGRLRNHERIATYIVHLCMLLPSVWGVSRSSFLTQADPHHPELAVSFASVLQHGASTPAHPVCCNALTADDTPASRPLRCRGAPLERRNLHLACSLLLHTARIFPWGSRRQRGEDPRRVDRLPRAKHNLLASSGRGRTTACFGRGHTDQRACARPRRTARLGLFFTLAGRRQRRQALALRPPSPRRKQKRPERGFTHFATSRGATTDTKREGRSGARGAAADRTRSLLYIPRRHTSSSFIPSFARAAFTTRRQTPRGWAAGRRCRCRPPAAGPRRAGTRSTRSAPRRAS